MDAAGYKTFRKDAGEYLEVFYSEPFPHTYAHRSSTLQDIEKRRKASLSRPGNGAEPEKDRGGIFMKMIEKDFYDILSEQAEKAPQAEAVVMGNVRLSYLEFVHRIDGVAAALRCRGLKRGDKVVLWSVSSPAWLYAYFGIIRSGGIAVILNANLSLADAKALMEFADTRYVLYGKSHDIAGHAEDAGKVAEASGLKEERCISIVDEAFTDVPANEPDRNGGNVRDDAFILYTSGTTAFPKAVLLSQFSLINVALYHYTDLILELIPRSIPYTRCLFDL